jgi:hypothetical protein
MKPRNTPTMSFKREVSLALPAYHERIFGLPKIVIARVIMRDRVQHVGCLHCSTRSKLGGVIALSTLRRSMASYSSGGTCSEGSTLDAT